MADLGNVFGAQGFDSSKVDPNDFDLIPAGEYDAIITKSELVQTKSGTGRMLKLQLQIINGQFQNRVLFDQLNIDNPNETAKKIALGTLSSICRAVNVPTPKDSSELHDKPLKISVKIKDGGEEYGKQNAIKMYKPRNAQAAPVPAGAAVGGAPAAPWKQNQAAVA